MDRIEISENDFNSRELDDNCGSESRRYLRDNKIYKFIYEYYRFNREIIVEQISKDQIINTPKPLEILTHNGNFIGYSMEYLKDYYTLNNFFKSSNYVYNSRFNSCMQLIRSLEDIIEKGYQHYDLHTSNVMIGDNKGAIIDVDSMCNPKINVRLCDSSFKYYDDLDEKNIISMMQKKLLNSILAIMFTKSIYEPLSNKKYELLDDFAGDEIMSSYIMGNMQFLIDRGYSLEDILYSLTEDKIEKYHELKKQR